MLVLKTPPITDWYNDSAQEFVTIGEQTLILEHSLVAISKWESKWCKPFLDPKAQRTLEESLDYIRCMNLNTAADTRAVYALTDDQMRMINAYLEHPATATTIHNRKPQKPSREIVTSEVIYYQMIELGIPFECEKWNLNRLMTLIQVCSIKGGPQQKMSRRDIMKENAALNAARRSMLGTRG